MNDWIGRERLVQTPSGKTVLIDGLPNWKYSIPERQDFFHEVAAMTFGGLSESESAIVRGEKLNQALQSAFQNYFKIVMVNDWYDTGYIRFDNDKREATFEFRASGLARIFVIDYYAVLQCRSYFLTDFEVTRDLLLPDFIASEQIKVFGHELR